MAAREFVICKAASGLAAGRACTASKDISDGFRFYDELARNFTVYAPTHPGFAGSDRPPWLESLIDLSRFYLWILQELGISKATLARSLASADGSLPRWR